MVTSLPSYLCFGARAAEPVNEPLLPRIALGDEDAFAECVRKYGKLVYAIAWRMLRDSRDVEDACQEIFFALWRSASTFEPERASEATFIALVARRRLVDRIRAPGTRALPTVEPGLDPSGAMLESYVDARNAAKALESCNDEQKRVILLSALSGLSHSEISEELSIPIGTVKSHYARGIERVKRALFKGEAKS